MATNTTYNPINVSDFEKSKLNFNAQGVSATITAGTSQNIDYTLTDDCLMTGAWLLTSNGTLGDKANFQVVDLTGAIISAMTGGAISTPGYVLNQFVTNWYLSTTTDVQLDMVYPAKLIAGMTLRIVYTSTGSTNPFTAINYKLHKVLV